MQYNLTSVHIGVNIREQSIALYRYKIGRDYGSSSVRLRLVLCEVTARAPRDYGSLFCHFSDYSIKICVKSLPIAITLNYNC